MSQYTAFYLQSQVFTCSDDAGDTNCDQCMHFAVKSESLMVMPQVFLFTIVIAFLLLLLLGADFYTAASSGYCLLAILILSPLR